MAEALPHPVILRDSDREYLLFIHASMRLKAKSIGQFKWDPKRQCWVYPLLPEIYNKIKAEFDGQLVDETSQQTVVNTTATAAASTAPAPAIALTSSSSNPTAALQAEIERLCNENMALRKQASEAAAKEQVLHAELERLKSVALAERLPGLEKQLVEKERKLRGLEADYSTLQMQVAELNERLRKAEQGPASTKRVAELEQLLSEKGQGLKDLQLKNSLLVDQVAKLTKQAAEIDNLVTVAADAASLKQELSDKDRRLANLRGDNAEIKRQLAEQVERVKELQQNTALLARIPELERSAMERRQMILALQAELTQLRTRLSTLNELNHDFDKHFRQAAAEASGQNGMFTKLIANQPVDTSLALSLCSALESTLSARLRRSGATVLQLISDAQACGIIDRDAAEFAHILRKQRNTLAHPRSPHNTKDKNKACVLICLYAAALLWPEIKEQPSSLAL